MSGFWQSVRADERLEKEFPLITLPLLILHGPPGSRFFHERAGSRDKTLKIYEGHVHDLLRDLDREAVMPTSSNGSRVPHRPRLDLTKRSEPKRRLHLRNEAALAPARHGDRRVRGQPDSCEEGEHLIGSGVPYLALEMQPAWRQGGSSRDRR